MAKARLKALLGRSHRDERGATLVITAVAMVAILGAGAMGVDLGFSVWGNRMAQSMADTAALDVVQNILTADSLSTDADVQTYLKGLLAGVDQDNGSNAGWSSVTPGWWQNGVFTASTASNSCAGTIFTTNPPPCNAVSVSATQTVPQPFRGGFATLTGHGGQGGGGGGGGG